MNHEMQQTFDDEFRFITLLTVVAIFLIVECILMGATIDYGILFTNYYLESRRILDIKEALMKAYAGSIHTIMTSGLILVTVTGVVGGMFEAETVQAIVKTLSIGSFCAIVLILFILPGVLAVCDKIVIKKKHNFRIRGQAP